MSRLAPDKSAPMQQRLSLSVPAPFCRRRWWYGIAHADFRHAVGAAGGAGVVLLVICHRQYSFQLVISFFMLSIFRCAVSAWRFNEVEVVLAAGEVNIRIAGVAFFPALVMGLDIRDLGAFVLGEAHDGVVRLCQGQPSFLAIQSYG